LLVTALRSSCQAHRKACRQRTPDTKACRPGIVARSLFFSRAVGWLCSAGSSAWQPTRRGDGLLHPRRSVAQLHFELIARCKAKVMLSVILDGRMTDARSVSKTLTGRQHPLQSLSNIATAGERLSQYHHVLLSATTGTPEQALLCRRCTTLARPARSQMRQRTHHLESP
jgi:hypothetical protein